MPKARLLIVAITLMLFLLSITGCKNLAAIKALTIDDVSFSSVRDGQYEGDQDNFMVSAKVNVSVSGGRVTNIQMLEHNHGPNHGADAIIPEVLSKQSLKVDSISGASYSSKVVLKAIELALKKGL